MSIDDKVWRERGAFVSSGDRWLGLVPKGYGGDTTDAIVAAGFRVGQLKLEEAWEVAYVAAPMVGPDGNAAFKRLIDLAAPLLTSGAQTVSVRPGSVLLFKDLNESDQDFWLDILRQTLNNIANVKRTKASGLLPAPAGFDPRRS